MPNLVIGRHALLTDHLILLLATATSRWVFRSHALYHMDSINFALGMRHFAPGLHQPHPPGYYLYIKLAQWVQHALPDPNDALVALSIAASCIAAALTYQLAHAWFGRRAARCAGLLFVFSPLAWFHGTVALVYILEAAMAALVGYLCWLTYQGRRNMMIPAAIAFGLAVGIRQSTALFLAPLLLLALRQTGWRHALLAIGAGILSISAWFFPMLAESGGYTAYFTALGDMWTWVSLQSATYHPAAYFRHILLLVATYGLCFGIAAPLLFVRGLPIESPPGMRIFLAAWLVPGLLFFLGGIFSPFTLGYPLFLCIPLFALLGAKAAALLNMAERGWRLLSSLALVATHTALFLYAPLYTSHAAVTRYEQDIARIEQGVRAIAPPDKTLVVGFDASFYGFRHVGYSLPEYLVLSHPEFRFSHGVGVFAMQDRKTRVLDSIPVGEFERFVLVTPPKADKLRRRLLARLPAGIAIENSAGHEFLTGPATALERIFPLTTRQEGVN